MGLESKYKTNQEINQNYLNKSISQSKRDLNISSKTLKFNIIIYIIYLESKDILNQRSLEGSPKNYYANFLKKAKEIKNNIRSNSNKSIAKASSHARDLSKSRNFIDINPIRDIKTADKRLTSDNIQNPYGVHNTVRSNNMDIGNVKTVRNNPFQNLRFNLDMINPIIRRISSRKSTSEGTEYI